MSIISIGINNTTYSTTLTGASTTWTISVPVPPGTYTTTISATDVAGNTNTLTPTSFTRQIVMTLPTLRLDASTDAGFLNSDGITNNPNPKLSGIVANGLTVQLYANDGTTTIGSPITPDGNGNWSYTLSGLLLEPIPIKLKHWMGMVMSRR